MFVFMLMCLCVMLKPREISNVLVMEGSGRGCRRWAGTSLRSHMLAWASAEVPLDFEGRAGLERCQGGAPIAVLTSLFLVLHLLSISSEPLIARPRCLLLGGRFRWFGP